jgi:hypothetical protein
VGVRERERERERDDKSEGKHEDRFGGLYFALDLGVSLPHVVLDGLGDDLTAASRYFWVARSQM